MRIGYWHFFGQKPGERNSWDLVTVYYALNPDGDWTLTDDWASALRLLEEVDRDNLKLYWQPNQFRDTEYNLEALRRELPYITNVHVFSWEGKDHFPLEKHESIWRQYLDILGTSGRDHNLLLEFMYNNEPEQLRTDAAVLKRWLA